MEWREKLCSNNIETRKTRENKDWIRGSPVCTACSVITVCQLMGLFNIVDLYLVPIYFDFLFSCPRWFCAIGEMFRISSGWALRQLSVTKRILKCDSAASKLFYSIVQIRYLKQNWELLLLLMKNAFKMKFLETSSIIK